MHTSGKGKYGRFIIALYKLIDYNLILFGHLGKKGEGMRQHFVRELPHVSLFIYVRALTHLYAP